MVKRNTHLVHGVSRDRVVGWPPRTARQRVKRPFADRCERRPTGYAPARAAPRSAGIAGAAVARADVAQPFRVKIVSLAPRRAGAVRGPAEGDVVAPDVASPRSEAAPAPCLGIGLPARTGCRQQQVPQLGSRAPGGMGRRLGRPGSLSAPFSGADPAPIPGRRRGAPPTRGSVRRPYSGRAAGVRFQPRASIGTTSRSVAPV